MPTDNQFAPKQLGSMPISQRRHKGFGVAQRYLLTRSFDRYSTRAAPASHGKTNTRQQTYVKPVPLILMIVSSHGL